MLQRDKRWEILYGDIALEDFVSKVPTFKFRAEVNREVVEAFDVVNKLVICSYFEYRFIDVALPRAFQLLEMALRIRYKELSDGSQWGNKPFYQLLLWCNKNSLFEQSGPGFSEVIRELRNYLSHPNRLNVHGMVGLEMLPKVQVTINQLYDDIDLRRNRWKSLEKLKGQLDSFGSNGIKARVMDREYVCNSFGPAYVANQVDPTMCFFSLLPVFQNPNEGFEPLSFRVLLSQMEIVNNRIDLSLGAGKVVISNLLSLDDLDSIHAFRKSLQNDSEFLFRNTILIYEAEKSLSRTLNELY